MGHERRIRNMEFKLGERERELDRIKSQREKDPDPTTKNWVFLRPIVARIKIQKKWRNDEKIIIPWVCHHSPLSFSFVFWLWNECSCIVVGFVFVVMCYQIDLRSWVFLGCKIQFYIPLIFFSRRQFLLFFFIFFEKIQPYKILLMLINYIFASYLGMNELDFCRIPCVKKVTSSWDIIWCV